MDDVSIEVKELWFNFDQETGIQADLAPQIRINFNYMYSKYFMYELQCREWRTQLQEDVNDYNNIEMYLDQLQGPYGFLDFKAQRENNIGMTFESIKEEHAKKMQFKEKHPDIHRIEKKIIDQHVDKYVSKIVKKMGFRKANWLGLT